MIFKIFLAFLFSININASEQQFILYSQHHLNPNINSFKNNISKDDPAFLSQSFLYEEIIKDFKENNISVLLLEGCDSNKEAVNALKSSSFNGWNIEKIRNSKNNNIITHIGLKILALNPQFEIYCADNDKLIAENNLTFSEIQGHFSFYHKFLTIMNNPKKYQIYRKNYFELEKFGEKEGAIAHAYNKVNLNIIKFEELIKKRNDYVVKKIKSLPNNKLKIGIIYGASHSKDLQEKINLNFKGSKILVKKHKNTQENLELIGKAKEITEQKISYVWPYPSDFKAINMQFPYLENKKNKYTKEEEDVFYDLLKYLDINTKLLYSDLDKDNIRDFTIAIGNNVILNIEDQDIDNDGVDNFFDNKAMSKKLQFFENSKEIEVLNVFNQKIKNNILTNKTFKSVKFFTLHNNSIDGIILNILENIIQKNKALKNHLKGVALVKNNFFNNSITKGSKASFLFASKLNQTLYINNNFFYEYSLQLREENFKDFSDIDFLQKIIIPILTHSLIHELYHLNQNELLKNKLAFQLKSHEIPIDISYLKLNREKANIISGLNSNIKIRNFSLQSYYKDLPKLELNELKKIFKELELPSIYATLNEGEYYAEMFSACFIKKYYKKEFECIKKENCLENIDFDPMVVKDITCEGFNL